MASLLRLNGPLKSQPTNKHKSHARPMPAKAPVTDSGYYTQMLDAFPTTKEKHRLRTTSGGTISIIACFVMLFLFFYELGDYWYPPTRDTLLVDTSTGTKMKINFDFTFPNLACAVVNLDATDISGEKQKDVEHNVFKRRLDSQGKQVGYHEKHEIGGTIKSIDELHDKPAAVDPSDNRTAVQKEKERKCGSCYGAETDELKCCDTCEQVREAYRKKGWSFAVRHNIRQCSREGFVDAVEQQRGEGCKVYGYIEVPKVAGNFHFAPGTGFRHAHNTVADLFGFTLKKWNVSHVINELSFGDPVPGRKNPLDGTSKFLMAGTGMYQYYAKVVPTDYVYRDGTTTETNQYSVTDHYRKIVSSRARGLPGIFVYYDLSPIKVKIVEEGSRLSGFLTSICAIVGGSFTVMSLLDRVITKLTAGRTRSSSVLGL